MVSNESVIPEHLRSCWLRSDAYWEETIDEMDVLDVLGLVFSRLLVTVGDCPNDGHLDSTVVLLAHLINHLERRSD